MHHRGCPLMGTPPHGAEPSSPKWVHLPKNQAGLCLLHILPFPLAMGTLGHATRGAGFGQLWPTFANLLISSGHFKHFELLGFVPFWHLWGLSKQVRISEGPKLQNFNKKKCAAVH